MRERVVPRTESDLGTEPRVSFVLFFNTGSGSDLGLWEGWFRWIVGAGAGLLCLSFVYLFTVKMMPTANVPFFDGAGESFVNYAPEVEKWNRVTYLDPF